MRLLIMHYLNSNFVYPGVMNKEMNVIMYNCGVKNKNEKVIRLVSYLKELGWFQDVNLIFLVKVNTKNEDYHHFNLIKKDWMKRYVYFLMIECFN